ncbi:MAG TPA: hypothetical protein VJB94_02010 [Candidatus Nanoarchaeia archaeon]|nr:hypothetical protein [Candidatus Nanoarchaeia archaeon]
MEIKKVSLTIGIAVLFALFIGFAIDAFYSGPDYNDFCKSRNYPYPEKPYQVYNESLCQKLNYKDPIYTSCTQDIGYVAYDVDENGCQINPYCETCQVKYDAENKIYSRNIFFITAVIGIIAILAGLMYIKLDAIASGFMFGGILTLIYGTARVFGDLSKVMRVVVLFIELVLLVYIGIKKSKK